MNNVIRVQRDANLPKYKLKQFKIKLRLRLDNYELSYLLSINFIITRDLI